MKKALSFAILTLMILVSCESNNGTTNNPDNGNGASFEYVSLTAEKTDIEIGEATKIKAKALGNSLIYYWRASAGDILGNGDEVYYSAAACCFGLNTITCTVKNDNGNKISKEIKINVY